MENFLFGLLNCGLDRCPKRSDTLNYGFEGWGWRPRITWAWSPITGALAGILPVQQGNV
jgi:hypothetical protein